MNLINFSLVKKLTIKKARLKHFFAKTAIHGLDTGPEPVKSRIRNSKNSYGFATLVSKYKSRYSTLWTVMGTCPIPGEASGGSGEGAHQAAVPGQVQVRAVHVVPCTAN